MTLYNSATVDIEINDHIVNRAKELVKFDIKPFDALHIASAESGKANIFLTVDKKLINSSKRVKTNIRIANPAIWIMEALYND